VSTTSGGGGIPQNSAETSGSAMCVPDPERSRPASALDSLRGCTTSPAAKRAKGAAKSAPNVTQLNAHAYLYGTKIRDAATALHAAKLARDDGDDDDGELERFAAGLVDALALPNAATLPLVKRKAHHKNANLRKCLVPVPRQIFTAAPGDRWLCLCGTYAKLATLAKVKAHLLTSGHISWLQPSRREDIAGGERVAADARAGAAAQTTAETLCRRIAVRATLMTAQHGDAFTAASRALRLAQSVVCDITDGVTPPPEVIARLRRPATSAELAAADALAADDAAVHAGVITQLRRTTGDAERRVVAEQLTRLSELSTMVPKNKHGLVPPLHLDRTKRFLVRLRTRSSRRWTR